MKVRIPTSLTHIALFFLLGFLCYEAHQLTRHLVGAALCGGFERMTFTVAITKEPCSLPTIVTLSGPLLTYGLAYLGMFLLQSRRTAVFGYALIFASFAHLRFIQTLSGRGDELDLMQQWFGISNRFIVAAIVMMIGIPPIVAAFRAIANERRVRVFIGSLLLPFPVLIALLVGDRLLFGASDQPTGAAINGSLGPTVLGIALLVVIVDIIAVILFVVFSQRTLARDIIRR